MHKFVGLGLILGAALLPANAAFAVDPDSSSLAFQDWTVNCAAAPKAADPKAAQAKPICETVQSFVEKNTGRLIARLAIGRPVSGGDMKIVLQAPVGVWLPDGATLAVTDKLSTKAVFGRCSSSACFAEVDAKKDFLDAAKTADKMTLTLSMNPGQPLTLTVSTKGFAAAMSDLEKK